MTVMFQDLFAFAMKRNLPSLLSVSGPSFDLGASGKFKVPGSVALGLPDWAFPRDNIPAKDDSVAMVHCFHFLEHLKGDDAIAMLREIERVLIPGGVLNFCMPYYNSSIQAQDLTHKSFWTEESFRTIFDNHYYDMAGSWRLKVHFQLICGIVERNMVLVGQLVRI